jgi:hypothetical protein
VRKQTLQKISKVYHNSVSLSNCSAANIGA